MTRRPGAATVISDRPRREDPCMTAPKRVTLAGPAVPPGTNGHSVREQSVDQPRLLAALRGVRAGDFGVRLPLDWTGVSGSISDVFNEVVELNERLNREFQRISQT